MSELITALLGFISAYFIFKQNDKSNQLKYITEERQKWREKIRELSVEFISGKTTNGKHRKLNKSEFENIKEQVAVRLNPDDDEDRYILCIMDCYIKTGEEKLLKCLSSAFAYLLKHDWERAKSEAKMKSNSFKVFLLLLSVLMVFFAISMSGIILEGIFLLWLKIGENIIIGDSNMEMSYFRIEFFHLLVNVLLVLVAYQALKFFCWLIGCTFENSGKCFCTTNKNPCSFDKYIGLKKRRRLSSKNCCKCGCISRCMEGS